MLMMSLPSREKPAIPTAVLAHKANKVFVRIEPLNGSWMWRCWLDQVDGHGMIVGPFDTRDEAFVKAYAFGFKVI